jgi:hypothetical protein
MGMRRALARGAKAFAALIQPCEAAAEKITYREKPRAVLSNLAEMRPGCYILGFPINLQRVCLVLLASNLLTLLTLFGTGAAFLALWRGDIIRPQWFELWLNQRDEQNADREILKWKQEIHRH